MQIIIGYSQGTSQSVELLHRVTKCNMAMRVNVRNKTYIKYVGAGDYGILVGDIKGGPSNATQYILEYEKVKCLALVALLFCNELLEYRVISMAKLITELSRSDAVSILCEERGRKLLIVYSPSLLHRNLFRYVPPYALLKLSLLARLPLFLSFFLSFFLSLFPFSFCTARFFPWRTRPRQVNHGSLHIVALI